jgi:glycerophosphoryl diester phosphodiesterase
MNLIDIPNLKHRSIRPGNRRMGLKSFDLLAKANFFPFLLPLAVGFIVFQFETLRALVALAFMKPAASGAADTKSDSVTIASGMRKPWVIAHRGASGHTPENTMAAFQHAVELGAGFIETDLHLTRDARFVVIHDAALERTTNGRGHVHDFTLHELHRLDAGMWYDRKFMGERIPTLENILEFSRKHDVVFYLEVKYDAAWGMHYALVGALQKSQDAARTIVISFDPSTLESIRKLDGSLMTGLLVERAVFDPIQMAVEVGARQLCPRHSMVTSDLIEKAHRADLHVATWTVNEPDDMRAMIAAGADGIMTDFPDRLQIVLEP